VCSELSVVKIFDFAFLYAVPLDSRLIRSLLLFFDGVAIVASPQRIAQALAAEPWFFLPFLQSDLSKVWTPDDFFDTNFRESYHAQVRALLLSGQFDNRPITLEMDRYLFPAQLPFVPQDWNVRSVHDESARVRDRLIGPGSGQTDAGTASGNLLDELKERGLLEVRQHVPMSGFHSGDPTRVGTALHAVTIGEDPTMDMLGSTGTTGPNVDNSHVLALDTTFSQVNDALVSQFARSRAAHRFGLALAPVNSSESSLSELLETWRISQKQVTVGRVVQQDLEVVGTGLEDVSLEELLQFREKHGQAHREYMRALRAFVRDMSQVSIEAQENELYDRRQELTERARGLSRLSRSTLKSGARFLMGITGAAISAAPGNVAGGIVSGAGALLGLGGNGDKGDALRLI
jgi:hypothetical protein